MKLNRYIDENRARLEWVESLDSIERTIAEVSLLTHENIILKSKLSNGCYFISFFLQQFLKLNFSIDIVVIVGWIEASHLPHPFSHSWIEFNGKMTDINLWNAVSEDGDFSGDLIVNGCKVRNGKLHYTYHHIIHEDSRLLMKDIIEGGDEALCDEVLRQFDFNKIFLDLSRKIDGADEIMNIAPAYLKYEQMCKLLDM